MISTTKRGRLADRLVSATVGVAMLAFLVGAPPAGAQTTADLQAQIAALLAQIQTLQAQLAALTGGGSAAACSFTRNLFSGVVGEDVRCLQKYLNSAGFTVAVSGAGSAGAETTFYGSLTQAAVAKWQAANSVSPSVGYFGPISRAKYSALIAVTPPPGPVTGPVSNVCVGSTAEGTFTAEKNPTPGSGETVREGNTNKAVLGVKIKTTSAPVRIQRLKLNVGTTTTQFKKAFSRVHVMDGSNTLASMDLNDSTVIKEGSNYFVTISGFDFGVAAGNTTGAALTIAADVRSSVDAADQHDWVFTVPVDGLRGTDCAGVNTFGPTTAFDNTVALKGGLAESAKLIMSTNSDTPKSQEIMAVDGSSNNEKDRLTLLHFDLKAEKDAIKVTDIVIEVDKDNAGGGTASTTVWLVSGKAGTGSGTVLGSATIASTDTATFSNIDFTVPSETTNTYTVQADIDSANISAAGFIARASSSGVTAESIQEGSITSANKTGSATGNEIFVRNEGPEWSLISKSIVKTQTAEQSNVSTSTVSATFTLRATARGAAIQFGDNASASPFFATTTLPVYLNGTRVSANADARIVASSTDFSVPSSGVTTSGIGSNSFQVAENNSVDIPVTFWFEGRTVAGALVTSGSYAVGVERLEWYSADTAVEQASTFMATLSDWRTSGVTLP